MKITVNRDNPTPPPPTSVTVEFTPDEYAFVANTMLSIAHIADDWKGHSFERIGRHMWHMLLPSMKNGLPQTHRDVWKIQNHITRAARTAEEVAEL